MKKLIIYIVMGLFVLSTSACFKSTKPEDGRAKCPACGYEFNVEDH